MRKVKAYIHIKAPVQTVQHLAGNGQPQWMVTRGSMLVRTLTPTWEATEAEGGTRFTLHMAYKPRLPFFDLLVGDEVQQSVAHSLGKLKLLAEENHARPQ